MKPSYFRDDRKTLLWVGDAVCASGFANATHQILEVLQQSYNVVVLGINSLGTPHSYPYEVWPCYPGGDLFGVGRLKEMTGRFQPDVVVLQNDPWNIPPYYNALKGIPTVGFLAVDGKNCQGHLLNGLALGIFWTEFGRNEARAGGFTGQSAVVPLGVDLNVFKPMDRVEARIRSGFPHHLRDAFVLGNINRNQPRKRMDLMVSYFAQWLVDCKVDDAYLYLHIAPTGEDAYDVNQLMVYYGFSSANNRVRLMQSEPEIFVGLPVEKVAQTYCTFDAMATTTQGEGWGLTTMEGMACGIPQIVPDWAALGEWTKGAAIPVPCREIAVTPTTQKSPVKINVIGGIADRDSMIAAFDEVYRNRELREKMSVAGLTLVSQPQYRWDVIGLAFKDALEAAVFPQTEVTVGV